MADEKKILLQLEIDANKSITQLVTVKDRIAKLKAEQKELNTTTLEGKKTYEAYQAQIKSLTKEQKSLELAVEKTAAGFEFEAGSIAANRAELSKLTAEYKNLANPTKEQTKKIKDLSDRLKEQEAAIGNTSRNVGNYKAAIQEALAGSGLFGSQIQVITQGFGSLKTGLQTAARGFTTLKGAVAATGIGLLVLAFGALISYFKRTDDGATKLEAIMAAVGAVVSEVVGFIAELGSTVFEAFSSVQNFGQAMQDLGEFLGNKFVNLIQAPIKAIEALIAAVSGDFDEANRLAKESLDGLTLGISGAVEGLSEAAMRAIDAAEASYNYAVALDAVNDAQRDLNVETAKSDLIVQKLIKTAANKTKSDKERISILLQANKIEEASFNKQFDLEKQRLKLIEDRNAREKAAINQRLQADIEEAKTEEEKIKLRQKLLSINDELAEEEAAQRIKVINLEKDFILLREKNQNKIDALQEKIDIDNQKRIDEQVAGLKKQYEAEVNLGNARIQNQIRIIDSELNTQTMSNSRRAELLKQRAELEIKAEQELTAQKLDNQELEEADRARIKEESGVRELEIQANLNKQLSDLADKQREEEKKKDDEAKAERKKKFNDTLSAANQLADALISLNNSVVESEIISNNKQREREIKAAGKNREQIDRINEKYDKKEQDARRKAAKQNARIQQIQALINSAVAITQTLASAPPPASIVLAAAMAVAAGAQVIAIENNTSKLAKGGVVKGPSHAAGGVKGTGRFNNIEVEGDEFVVNKRSTKAFFPLLTKINEVGNRPAVSGGGGFRRFATGGFLDGGLSARNAGGTIVSDIQAQNQTMEIIDSIPAPIVLVQDIDTLQSKRARVKDMARVTR